MNHRFSLQHSFLSTRWAATRLPFLVVLLFLMLTLPYLAFGADGVLDPTFGGDGIVTTDIRGFDIGRSVAVQADGKILVAGDSEIFGGDSVLELVRYNSDGTLDNSFGSDGIVTATVGIGHLKVSDMAVQGDGKILLVAGYGSGPSDGTDFTLVRYNSDGSLDSSFGSDGIVTTDIGIGAVDVFDMVMQADNKIFVVGQNIADPSHYFSKRDIVLVRYESDGSLDSSLGVNGIVTNTLAIGASDMAIQADNTILVVGYNISDGSLDSSISAFALARYNSDGSLDSSLGSDDIVTTPIGNCGDWASAVALQGDGKILVAGTATIGDSVCSDESERDLFALARYNNDGTLDSSFDSDGVVTTTISTYRSQAVDLAVQGDGKILVAGNTLYGFGPPPFYTSYFEFAVARYNSDGTLDSSFDGNGVVTTSIRMFSFVGRMAVQGDGKILVVGHTYTYDEYAPGNPSINSDIALARYEGGPTTHRLYLPFTR